MEQYFAIIHSAVTHIGTKWRSCVCTEGLANVSPEQYFGIFYVTASRSSDWDTCCWGFGQATIQRDLFNSNFYGVLHIHWSTFLLFDFLMHFNLLPISSDLFGKLISASGNPFTKSNFVCVSIPYMLSSLIPRLSPHRMGMRLHVFMPWQFKITIWIIMMCHIVCGFFWK